MAYATAEQLAATLPGGASILASRSADLERVLDVAALEIDMYLDKEEPFDFSDEGVGTAAYPVLVNVNIERAGDLWHMEQIQSGLLLGGETPLLAPRDSWMRYANRLSMLKERWGLA